MSSYAIRVEGEDGARGAYLRREEVTAALEERRAERGDLAGVSVWEMPEHGSAGREVPVADFIDE